VLLSFDSLLKNSQTLRDDKKSLLQIRKYTYARVSVYIVNLFRCSNKRKTSKCLSASDTWIRWRIKENKTMNILSLRRIIERGYLPLPSIIKV